MPYGLSVSCGLWLEDMGWGSIFDHPRGHWHPHTGVIDFLLITWEHSSKGISLPIILQRPVKHIYLLTTLILVRVTNVRRLLTRFSLMVTSLCSSQGQRLTELWQRHKHHHTEGKTTSSHRSNEVKWCKSAGSCFQTNLICILNCWVDVTCRRPMNV